MLMLVVVRCKLEEDRRRRRRKRRRRRRRRGWKTGKVRIKEGMKKKVERQMVRKKK